MTDPAALTSEQHTRKLTPTRPHRAQLTNFSAVLDACVLVNATVRDFLLYAGACALYRPLWSRDILDEVRRTLEGFGIAEMRVTYMIEHMESAFPEARVEGYERLIPSMQNDDGDRHVLAAAVTGGAQVVVTDNLRHFKADDLDPLHIEALSADDFLRDLLDVDPERMLLVLNDITSARKFPPKTIDELLEALANNGCPGFASDLKEALEEKYADS